MKIDTHVHLLISKKQLEADLISINAMLDTALASDIMAICVTEHIEAVGYDKLMTDLFIDNILQGTVFEDHILTKQGIRLYPGAEVQLENGTNIGVHTKLETLLSLNHQAGFYTLPKLAFNLKESKVWYKLVAHHIFWPNKTYPDHDELAKYVDAIEIPAKDLENAAKYIALADSYNLPTTGGSDAHTFIQIGACHSDLSNVHINESHPLDIAFNSNKKNHYFTDFSKRLVAMSKIYRSVAIA